MALSSLLGLLGTLAYTTFASVWAQNLVADAVFVAGSVAVAVWTYRRANDEPDGWKFGVAIAAAILLTLAVYDVSYAIAEAYENNVLLSIINNPPLVGAAGLPGLLFAGIAPAVLGRRDA
ncbi:MAG: hypothetical protein QOE90_1558 [Thermoplasmata archaeon]|nr:hypothetical protein [Thermoplasmata archaeon]